MVHLSYLQAVVIGALQGLAELFPISSLGHTVLIPAFIGGSWESLVHKSYFLEIAVLFHFSTAVGLLLFYGKTWIRIVKSVIFWRKGSPEFTLAQFLVTATLPTVLIGFFFNGAVARIFGKPIAAAIFLVINGLLLFIVRQIVNSRPNYAWITASAASEVKTLSIYEILGIGIAQSLAFFPGISRFGIVLMAVLLLGISLQVATEFAFLLSFPIIIAAAVYKIPRLLSLNFTESGGPVLIGCLTAFACSIAAIIVLKKWAIGGSLTPFAIYCVIVGCICVLKFAA